MKQQLAWGVVAAVMAAAPVLANAQQASEGKWLVRGRVLSMKNDNKNEPPWPNGTFTATDKVFPELDITYFWTRNIATELVLTYPQKHSVLLNGDNIGSVKQLPPTLMVQWHFIPEGTLRPYLGVGINYTQFSGVNLSVPGADIERSSWGFAYGGGVDWRIVPGGKWFVNLDVKHVAIDTDVTLNGAKLTTLKIDPWLYSLGLGYRF